MTANNAKFKDMTDEELMILVQEENDEEAFEEIVVRYQHPLTTFITRFVGYGSHVEDILQDTFIRVWKHRRRYKTVARFSTWVYTIAGNLAKTELRRLKIRRSVYIRTGGEPLEDEGVDVIDTTADPESDASREEIRRLVAKEMKRLPEAYRMAVILRDVNDKSYEEVSEILGVPVGTVKSRINRGRARLQKRLGNLRDPGQAGWEPEKTSRRTH